MQYGFIKLMQFNLPFNGEYLLGIIKKIFQKKIEKIIEKI
jgi:hypothetical protein